MGDYLDDKLDVNGKGKSRNRRHNSDPLKQYFKEMGEKPLLTARQEIELAKEIEDRHRELTYVFCQYGNSQIKGLELLDEGIERVLGKENAFYEEFEKLQKRISKSRKAETLTKLYDQVFELFYNRDFESAYWEGRGLRDEGDESDGWGRPGQFICDVAKASVTIMPQKYRTRMTHCLSSIEQTKEKFAEANLRLVINIAKNYQNRGLSLPDLIQEGNIGLMKAVDRYDYKKGFKFATYASWWIRQTVDRAVQDKGRTIRLPVHFIESLRRCRNVANELSHQLEREPSNEEIAKYIRVPVKKVERAFSIRGICSLDQSIDDNGTTRMKFVKDGATDFSEDLIAKDYCKELLSELKPKEADILRQRFGFDGKGRKMLAEIGKQYGVTRERIRQIELVALNKLRKKVSLERRREKLGVGVRSEQQKIETLFDNWMPQTESISLAPDKKTDMVPVTVSSVQDIYFKQVADVKMDSKNLEVKTAPPQKKPKKKTYQPYNRSIISLDELINGGKTTLMNVVETIGFSRYGKVEGWREILGVLKPKETSVIVQWFNLDSEGKRSLEEMSEQYGVSEQKIRRIQRNALEKIGKLARARMRSQKRE